MHCRRKPVELPLPGVPDTATRAEAVSRSAGGWRRRVPGGGRIGGHGRRAPDGVRRERLAEPGTGRPGQAPRLACRRRDILGAERQRSLPAAAAPPGTGSPAGRPTGNHRRGVGAEGRGPAGGNFAGAGAVCAATMADAARAGGPGRDGVGGHRRPQGTPVAVLPGPAGEPRERTGAPVSDPQGSHPQRHQPSRSSGRREPRVPALRPPTAVGVRPGDRRVPPGSARQRRGIRRHRIASGRNRLGARGIVGPGASPAGRFRWQELPAGDRRLPRVPRRLPQVRPGRPGRDGVERRSGMAGALPQWNAGPGGRQGRIHRRGRLRFLRVARRPAVGGGKGQATGVRWPRLEGRNRQIGPGARHPPRPRRRRLGGDRRRRLPGSRRRGYSPRGGRRAGVTRGEFPLRRPPGERLGRHQRRLLGVSPGGGRRPAAHAGFGERQLAPDGPQWQCPPGVRRPGPLEANPGQPVAVLVPHRRRPMEPVRGGELGQVPRPPRGRPPLPGPRHGP